MKIKNLNNTKNYFTTPIIQKVDMLNVYLTTEKFLEVNLEKFMIMGPLLTFGVVKYGNILKKIT